MIDVAYPYFDTNLSWLSNNYRLLLEANDETVPVRERLRFLGIYAYQTSEFFRARVPSLLAMGEVSNDIRTKLNLFPESLLEHVYETVENQLREFNDILTAGILPALHEQGVHLYYQETFANEHLSFLRKFFIDKLFRHLQPVFLDSRRSSKMPFFESKQLYLVVRLQHRDDSEEDWYALVNIPSEPFGRFIELPELDGRRQLTFLEDIVRENLPLLFPGYDVLESYALRVEKDTELSIEDEYPMQIAQRILKQLEKRNFVQPAQYFYESGMPLYMREYLVSKAGIPMNEFHERGHYILMQDLMTFPQLSRRLDYAYQRAVQNPDFNDTTSVFESIQKADQLLHLPYHSYEPIVRFFNEAAVDPHVREIHVSLYKISPNSFILNSLISAARNGKRVTTYVELNTKLDIQENLHWSKKMRDAGVKIILSVPGLKVHAKIALIKRKVQKGWERYAFLGTGGFYRLTSREIVDHALLTSHRELTNELELLFGYLSTQDEPKKYKYLPFNYLFVTQFTLQKRLLDLIDREIANCNAGLKSFVTIKINQLQDHILIDKIYQAGQAGVPVHVIISESCGLIPGLPSISDNIVVSRYVDRYVENTRIFHFGNRGNDEMYLSSCDWTHRNLHRRIDVCFPILDETLKSQMRLVLRNYVNDNQKAVRLDVYQNNLRITDESRGKVRAQEANYRLTEKMEKAGPAKRAQ
ncbi:polyphosphate kinase 1 [Dyadobacter chenwenxiniae]|uniref:Polyphosphate kinase n=1 Tax=Dyadobacter chenwenxiniae TaxID=2906456 RepID=A0A9X1PM00_9BACT|nr:polyphosphate kinase 1 [Dyadobacter chenwenxiniae]MCF0062399.1 polyphosphate kinase 1 [Dyadobacter chenwenxiniae]UON83847.1 polyphosphate kinase 1 [Dyadobacter chenwenxiniae]